MAVKKFKNNIVDVGEIIRPTSHFFKTLNIRLSVVFVVNNWLNREKLSQRKFFFKFLDWAKKEQSIKMVLFASLFGMGFTQDCDYLNQGFNGLKPRIAWSLVNFKPEILISHSAIP